MLPVAPGAVQFAGLSAIPLSEYQELFCPPARLSTRKEAAPEGGGSTMIFIQASLSAGPMRPTPACVNMKCSL
jgi:hypothetical protein